MTENVDNSINDQLRLIDSFLVDNQELESINDRLSSFNLFSVLRIEKAEIRHSNILAWLLNPNESHGLRDTFLRRFISRLLMENDQIPIALTPAQIELIKFSDIEVMREWNNIDVLVRSHNEKWCLLIENKIGSKESKGQLEKYINVVKKDVPNYQIISVLLTLEGDEPSDAAIEVGYIPLSHTQVLDVAERIVKQNYSKIPSDAQVLINHYLDILRRLTMQDDELIDLCKTVYRKHRQAIDLIVEYGSSSQALDACQEEIGQIVDCEFISRSGRRILFLPSEMGIHLPNMKMNGWGNVPRPVPVVCWFLIMSKRGKFQCVIEVGPIADPKLRLQFMETLSDAGFEFWKKGAMKEGAKYTRIVSKIHKLKKDEDDEFDDSPEYIKGLTGSLWSKVWEDGSKIISVLKNFKWD